MLALQLHKPVIDGSEVAQASEVGEDGTINGGR
jgi:hypothetical protein